MHRSKLVQSACQAVRKRTNKCVSGSGCINRIDPVSRHPANRTILANEGDPRFAKGDDQPTAGLVSKGLQSRIVKRISTSDQSEFDLVGNQPVRHREQSVGDRRGQAQD